MTASLLGWYVATVCTPRGHEHPPTPQAVLACALDYIRERKATTTREEARTCLA